MHLPSSLSSLSCLLLLLISTASAAIVRYDLDIGYIQNVNADGHFARRVIGVNGKWPPPKLIANYNDTLVINVRNSLDVPTALHSHGMFFNKTNYFDGAAGVTQCGIPPGSNFTYEIPLQQWGTYWYHAHVRGQYLDGFRGALIINPPPTAQLAKYDHEYTLILHDWYHDEYDTVMKDYGGIFNVRGVEPPPNSGIVHIMNGTDYVPKMTFIPNKTYRIRVINMAGFPMFTMGIGGHEMEVIEVDGVDTEPKTASNIEIGVAQRYSVLVKAKNATDMNYNVAIKMDDSMFALIPPTLNLNLTALIEYSPTAPTSDAPPPSTEVLDDLTIAPLVKEASVAPDVSHDLNVFLGVLDDGINHGQFNNNTYVAPLTPTMLSALTTGQDATNPAIYGKQTNAIVLEHNKMIQLVVNNDDGGSHPFHLHGHRFQIVYRSEQRYDPTQPIPDQPNPIRRDTVQIPAFGSAVIRFRSDNPGVWLFHCHIQWHMEVGLVATLIEAPLEMQKTITPPSYVGSQCAALGKPISGNAAGKQGLDLTGAPDGPHNLSGKFETKGIIALIGTIVSAVLGMSVVVWFAKE
ncbi:uncharacterized protein SPPG_05711 [Spizellomyces punctatus DAOM BR117]|uniref:L-ascorbate oxidase n=1 Tax=Spizellomyces punctatus (strain DAOM BR117) TaxID=645134 RepID=A0A0L0HEM4_SPIPD|nr:uncharacterized protein SPPG_05711 [Spizellomyces punctatus DAOM BR117]KNC99476.1 hypothetical protein SPPG_05711 [Spizellomyces punctatus DAOM BR117]|eukprot:XP_016607516.1 hypothetical protein SPPG_05711 [Spizellomyces punctatus DAOM BR117]